MSQSFRSEADALTSAARDRSLLFYVKTVFPWFILEEIHCVIASYLEAAAEGKIDRLMISLPPRAGKSTLTSIASPSWWMGKFPSDKIMQIAYSSDLSKRFSRQVLQAINSPAYAQLFPHVRISKDAHAADYWNVEDITSVSEQIRRGEYRAAGVTSGIAGSGFNLGIIDDPLSEQDKDSKRAKDRVWEWYGAGFYTRRQPEKNIIILIATRWALDDLSGRLRAAARSGGDSWEVVNIPAILDGDIARKIHTVAKEYGFGGDMEPVTAGGSFAPRRFTPEELDRTRANVRERDWQALYMGKPTEEEGAILKRKYWRLWPHKDLPEFLFVFQMYDTAFEASETADYSAMTSWGIFEYRDREGRATVHMMLIGKWKRRVESPDLPKVVEALCHGSKHMAVQKSSDPTRWSNLEAEVVELIRGPGQTIGPRIRGGNPHRVMIENKASGINLIKELRRRKDPAIPVHPWNPPLGTRGQLGKYARAQFGAMVLEEGSVWYLGTDWALEAIDECAKCKFDGSDASDDLPDTVAAALIYVRQTYRVEMDSDIDEDEEERRDLLKKRTRKFYG
jgi:hypothetical protein